jgi:hypothetical protein
MKQLDEIPQRSTIDALFAEDWFLLQEKAVEVERLANEIRLLADRIETGLKFLKMEH